jgi:hypothetical protein
MYKTRERPDEVLALPERTIENILCDADSPENDLESAKTSYEHDGL